MPTVINMKIFEVYLPNTNEDWKYDVRGTNVNGAAWDGVSDFFTTVGGGYSNQTDHVAWLAVPMGPWGSGPVGVGEEYSQTNPLPSRYYMNGESARKITIEELTAGQSTGTVSGWIADYLEDHPAVLKQLSRQLAGTGAMLTAGRVNVGKAAPGRPVQKAPEMRVAPGRPTKPAGKKAAPVRKGSKKTTPRRGPGR